MKEVLKGIKVLDLGFTKKIMVSQDAKIDFKKTSFELLNSSEILEAFKISFKNNSSYSLILYFSPKRYRIFLYHLNQFFRRVLLQYGNDI